MTYLVACVGTVLWMLGLVVFLRGFKVFRVRSVRQGKDSAQVASQDERGG